MINEIPHNKLIRGVMIVKSEYVSHVIDFLEKQSVTYHTRIVEFSEDDCNALELSKE